jgi:trehalose synthase
VQEIEVVPRPRSRLDGSARPADLARFDEVTRAVAADLRGRTVWHVNSTASGGGVAELLSQLLGYLPDGGIRCRWVVIDGSPGFFRLTKRIHNRLHGSPGDAGPLGATEQRLYGRIIERELGSLLAIVRRGDVAVLHDPQTAGLAGPLLDAGLHVIWVCHIGIDEPNDLVRSAWGFLRPEIERADAVVFSRRAYVWAGLAGRRVRVIPPCIDPTSAKNMALAPAEVAAVLDRAGIVGSTEHRSDVRVRIDGAEVEVRHAAHIVQDEPVPPGAPIVVQVSRWDRLKDHVGVLDGFAEHVVLGLDAHLLLVGPAAASVADDPEGKEVFAENVEARHRLPLAQRRRIHIVSLPVEDQMENAVVVNALQRRADVVVQKSLAEGFGLTVAEAMWKERPVVGARVGGIQDQIRDGRSGLLVDPTDLAAMGGAISSLIGDAGLATAIGHAARSRVRAHFLPPHFLGAHLRLVREVLDRDGA